MSDAGDLRIFDSPQALAEAVADAFVSDAAAAVSQNGVFNVALAGGTTPKAAYALLAQEPRRSRVDWSRVHVFFSDERCVPPESADSNYRMADETFLRAVPIDAANVHRIRGEDEPAEAAADYATVIIALLGEDPRFDLIMLGMGPDGHTASLFPGADPHADEAELVRAVWVEKLQSHRITFTPALINAARHVLVAAEGSSKAAMLKTVREGERDPVKYPIQSIAPEKGAMQWFVDRQAASR